MRLSCNTNINHVDVLPDEASISKDVIALSFKSCPRSAGWQNGRSRRRRPESSRAPFRVLRVVGRRSVATALLQFPRQSVIKPSSDGEHRCIMLYIAILALVLILFAVVATNAQCAAGCVRVQFRFFFFVTSLTLGIPPLGRLHFSVSTFYGCSFYTRTAVLLDRFAFQIVSVLNFCSKLYCYFHPLDLVCTTAVQNGRECELVLAVSTGIFLRQRVVQCLGRGSGPELRFVCHFFTVHQTSAPYLLSLAMVLNPHRHGTAAFLETSDLRSSVSSIRPSCSKASGCWF